MNLQAIQTFRDELVAKHNLDLAACDRLLGKAPSETLAARELPLATAGTFAEFCQSIRRRGKPAKAGTANITPRRAALALGANLREVCGTFKEPFSTADLIARAVERGHGTKEALRIPVYRLVNRLANLGELTAVKHDGTGKRYRCTSLPAKAAAPSANPEIERRQKNYEEIRGSIHVPRDINAGNYE